MDRLKVKGQKKIFHISFLALRKNSMAVLMSDKVDCKAKKITRPEKKTI